ncbi:MAG: phytoene desaturase family protein [Turicibacter sp.]
MGQKVSVIGAGIGGLATALRLLKAGYDVTVFEKEEDVGGKVNQIKSQEGYTFDMNATVLLLPQPFYELFQDIGLDLSNYMDVTLIEPNYRVFFEAGDAVDFNTNLAKLVPMLEENFKEDSVGYLNWLQDVYQKYLLINDSFLTQSFEAPLDFFNPKTLKDVIKSKPFKSTYDYISHFVKDERLRQFLCFQTMYIGMNPYQSSNVYTVLPGVTQAYGLYYIKGGMYTFVKTLKQLIKEMGGTIHTNHLVTQIVIEKKQVKGLAVNGQLIESDLIIANADVPYVNHELLNKPINHQYDLSCSTYILYMGVNKKLPQLTVHNIYLGPNFEKNISAPFIGNIPTQPSFYIYSPSQLDDTMAPPGCECLSVTIRVPNLTYKDCLWDAKTKDKLKQKIYVMLNKILQIEDIQSIIEFQSELTPVDLLEKFNAYKGCAFGVNHNLLQTNYFRPHHKSDEITGLYYVGASTHPGTGISLVLNSAKLLVSELISHN